MATSKRSRSQLTNDHCPVDTLVFRPTIEEWADPVKYIANISKQAAKYGVVIVRPPAGWNPPSQWPTLAAVKDERLAVKATRQNLNSLADGEPYQWGRSYLPAQYKTMADKLKGQRYPQFPHPVLDAATGTATRSSGSERANTAVGTYPLRGTNDSIEESAAAIEKLYWGIVDSGSDISGEQPDVEVDYCNDQDVRKQGSGFPMRSVPSPFHVADERDWTPPASDLPVDFSSPEYYRECGWNLTNLPFLAGSLLRYVPEEVNGLNIPWLYYGCLFATFSWHNEDNWAYSINYMHEGEGKMWYGVPSHGTAAFEAYVLDQIEKRSAAKRARKLASDAAAAAEGEAGAGAGSSVEASAGAGAGSSAPAGKSSGKAGKAAPLPSPSSSTGRGAPVPMCMSAAASKASSSRTGPDSEATDPLYNLTMMVNPRDLLAAGVPVVRAVQCPGDFIITMPQAYHAGFSLGWTMSEAVNFALPDWLSWGSAAVQRYADTARLACRSPAFAHEQLVLNMAKRLADLTDDMLPALVKQLQQIVTNERNDRCELGVQLAKATAERHSASLSAKSGPGAGSSSSSSSSAAARSVPAVQVPELVKVSSDQDDRLNCLRCQRVCHVSGLVCTACPLAQKRMACLRHGQDLCRCPLHKRTLVYWWSPRELDKLLEDAYSEANRRGVNCPVGQGHRPGQHGVHSSASSRKNSVAMDGAGPHEAHGAGSSSSSAAATGSSFHSTGGDSASDGPHTVSGASSGSSGDSSAGTSSQRSSPAGDKDGHSTAAAQALAKRPRMSLGLSGASSGSGASVLASASGSGSSREAPLSASKKRRA